MDKKTVFKILLILVCFFLLSFSIPTAQAQILPKTDKNTQDCLKFLANKNLEVVIKSASQDERADILGCTIKTGKIELWMVPFFIVYLINFLLAIAGLIAVLFIVVGGYWYIIGAVQGQTDKGKSTILYAIAGLIVTLMAWIIVNIIQSAVT